MIIGYARVSTDGQTLDAQQAALKTAGAAKVYSEKVSGTVTDRRALARAIAALGPVGTPCSLHASTGSPARPGTC
jgi:DNA invertase Pin-like site-specific DNA recombinase